jgi:hypothetical protein
VSFVKSQNNMADQDNMADVHDVGDKTVVTTDSMVQLQQPLGRGLRTVKSTGSLTSMRETKSYHLNKPKAFRQKLSDTNRPAGVIDITPTGGGVLLTTEPVTFELMRVICGQYYANYPHKGLSASRSEATDASGENVVQETYFIKPMSAATSHSYTLNFYLTKSSMLLNGKTPHLFLETDFKQHILPALNDKMPSAASLDDILDRLATCIEQSLSAGIVGGERIHDSHSNNRTRKNKSVIRAGANLEDNCRKCNRRCASKSVYCNQGHHWIHYVCDKLSAQQILECESDTEPESHHCCRLCSSNSVLINSSSNNIISTYTQSSVDSMQNMSSNNIVTTYSGVNDIRRASSNSSEATHSGINSMQNVSASNIVSTCTSPIGNHTRGDILLDNSGVGRVNFSSNTWVLEESVLCIVCDSDLDAKCEVCDKCQHKCHVHCIQQFDFHTECLNCVAIREVQEQSTVGKANSEVADRVMLDEEVEDSSCVVNVSHLVSRLNSSKTAGDTSTMATADTPVLDTPINSATNTAVVNNASIGNAPGESTHTAGRRYTSTDIRETPELVAKQKELLLIEQKLKKRDEKSRIKELSLQTAEKEGTRLRAYIQELESQNEEQQKTIRILRRRVAEFDVNGTSEQGAGTEGRSTRHDTYGDTTSLVGKIQQRVTDLVLRNVDREIMKLEQLTDKGWEQPQTTPGNLSPNISSRDSIHVKRGASTHPAPIVGYPQGQNATPNTPLHGGALHVPEAGVNHHHLSRVNVQRGASTHPASIVGYPQQGQNATLSTPLQGGALHVPESGTDVNHHHRSRHSPIRNTPAPPAPQPLVQEPTPVMCTPIVPPHRAPHTYGQYPYTMGTLPPMTAPMRYFGQPTSTPVQRVVNPFFWRSSLHHHPRIRM